MITYTHDEMARLYRQHCPQCGGRGIVRERYGKHEHEYECDCVSGFDRRCEDAEIPPLFQHAGLDVDWDYIQPPTAREWVQGYVANIQRHLNNNTGLLLLGPVGCGKTRLAVGIAKLAIAYGKSALFVNVPEWFQQLRDSYNDSRRSSERDLLQALYDVDVLILDDLGAERTSGWVQERLYLVINARYSMKKINLVTSNLALEVLEHVIGEASISRLYSRALVVQLNGTDYRRIERERLLAYA